MPENSQGRTCFMAMPITTKAGDVELYGGDEQHWQHVMRSLFEKAIHTAGFEPVRPIAQGAHLIHGQIIKNLSTAHLVLVDLSSHNPNVFFELGVRTSLNLPIALVRDEHTQIPFDTSGINTFEYNSALKGWEIESQQQELAQHIERSFASCNGTNPLWRQFGLTIKAAEPDTNESPLEAKVDLLADRVMAMQQQFAEERHEREIERRNIEVDSARIRQAARRRLADEVQRDRHAADPEASARPATINFERFKARVEAIAEERGIPVRVGRVGNGRAIVFAPEDVHDGEFSDSVAGLASRYDLQVQFRTPDDEPGPLFADRSGRLRPWPPKEP